MLAEEVLPTYYDRHEAWVDMMVASIQSTRDAFGVQRMLQEYFDRMYLKRPAR